jgi:hypothetical protein
MRRFLSTLVVVGVVIGGLERARDELNARRLARRLGCSLLDARRVYAIARRTGFGAAYREVFGDSAVTGRGEASRPAT